MRLSPGFRKQEVRWIQACVGAGKAKPRVTTEQLMEQRRTGTPKAEDKNGRVGNRSFQNVRMARILQFEQPGMNHAVQTITEISAPF